MRLQSVYGTILQEDYPDAFSTTEEAKTHLEMLANISGIQAIIEHARARSNEITRKRLADFLRTKTENLYAYHNGLQESVRAQIKEIQGGNIEKLQKQIKALENQKDSLRYGLQEAYDDGVHNLKRDLRQELSGVVTRYIQYVTQQAKGAEGTTTETYRYQDYRGGTGFLDYWFPRYATGYRELTTVKAGYVRSELESTMLTIQNAMEQPCEDCVFNWKKDVNKAMMDVVEESDPEGKMIDIKTIRKIIRDVINSIESPEIPGQELPNELKRSGTLQGSDAENFIDTAKSYIRGLENTMKNAVANYLRSLGLEHDISTDIVSRYKRKMKKTRE